VPGYYGKTADTCKVCPEGGDCKGGDDIIAAAGWWRSPLEYDKFLECQSVEACPGGDQCGIGYTGRLCSECATTPSKYYKLGYDCKRT
jgi:hypothetical protein